MSLRNNCRQTPEFAEREENSADTTEDETSNENESIKEPRNMRLDGSEISSSQESTTALHRDRAPANHDMIQFYLEHVTKGGSIQLKSVGKIKDDALL